MIALQILAFLAVLVLVACVVAVLDLTVRVVIELLRGDDPAAEIPPAQTADAELDRMYGGGW